MSRTLGYVGLEFNQASHEPEVIQGEIWKTEEEARACADWVKARTRESGRRERYAVGTIEIDEEEWENL